MELTDKGTLLRRLGHHRWPVIVTAVMVVVGLAYTLEWGPLVDHSPVWTIGGDLWGIFRGAHYVGWGYLGGVYTGGNGVLAFPGMEVLLAPVAMLSSSLHLTESYPPFVVPHPSAALILQPVELLLAGTAVFACDALAERLGVAWRRRLALSWAVGAVAWPVAALWGHAEDIVATTFAIYAMIALVDGRWSRCGWLLGFGVAFQPLVAMLIPVFLGASPRGQRLAVAARSLALSAILVAIAVAGNPSETLNALLKQPTPPSVNHATPWAALSPQAGRGTLGGGLTVGEQGGHFSMMHVVGRPHTVLLVSGGAGRIVDVVVAVLIGLYVWRRPQGSERLIWICGVVLATRCFFEPVMTPYYLAPPLIIGLVMASRVGPKRFWAAVVLCFEVTLYAYFRLGPWQWWLPVAGGLIGMIALGFPDRVAGTAEHRSEQDEPFIAQRAAETEAPGEPVLQPAL